MLERRLEESRENQSHSAASFLKLTSPTPNSPSPSPSHSSHFTSLCFSPFLFTQHLPAAQLFTSAVLSALLTGSLNLLIWPQTLYQLPLFSPTLPNVTFKLQFLKKTKNKMHLLWKRKIQTRIFVQVIDVVSSECPPPPTPPSPLLTLTAHRVTEQPIKPTTLGTVGLDLLKYVTTS